MTAKFVQRENVAITFRRVQIKNVGIFSLVWQYIPHLKLCQVL